MDDTANARILVAIDPDKHPHDPLMLGARLAELTATPLDVATVVGEVPWLLDAELQDQVRRDAEAHLAQFVAASGVPVSRMRAVTASSPARALQELSEEDGVAMVVIGSTTRGALRRTLPGSIADRLLSGAAAAVAVAPHGFADGAPERLETVGVAFDGSPESRVALDAATRLARRAGAHVRVITVHQYLTVPNVSLHAIPVDTVDEAVEREQRRALDEAIAERGDVSIEGIFKRGRPLDVLVAASSDVDLLVAGSRGYGPLGAVLLGSTTHDLARMAHSPLLITPRRRG